MHRNLELYHLQEKKVSATFSLSGPNGVSQKRLLTIFSLPFSPALIATWALAFLLASHLHAADEKHWQRSPYQITLQLAIDTAAWPDPALGEAIAERIRQRVDTSCTPLWLLKVDITGGPRRHKILSSLAAEPWDTIPQSIQSGDKLMFLSVEACFNGYQLKCRELDCYTRRWGPVLEHHQRQRAMLAEGCFRLLCDCFAPLAQVQTIPDDPKQVRLLFKASELANLSNSSWLIDDGDRFQPLVRRTDRSGQLLPSGVEEVPWTYLTPHQEDARVDQHDQPKTGPKESPKEVTGPALDQDTPARPALGGRLCDVQSGLRRPFGVRRHGRNENLALSIRHHPDSIRVRFYARHDQSRGLAGYEVYLAEPQPTNSSRQEGQEKPVHRLLGRTNRQGTILVIPNGNPIMTLLLISDGRSLAKVPLAPGITPLLEVPVADDPARLRAQARLTEIREELIDLVARRNLLMGRIRYSITAGKIDQAQDLVVQLGELKGRSQFNQTLSSAEKDSRIRSTDAKVQIRIDRMLADTRSLLGRFLDGRPISELEHEVLAASRGTEAETGPPESTPESTPKEGQ
jgi:hypothetical protein